MTIAGQIKLEAASTAFHAVSEEVFGGQRESLYGRFAHTMPCEGEFLELNALTANTIVREIVGSRRYGSLRGYANRVRVKRWGPDALRIPILKILKDSEQLTGSALRQYVDQVANFYEIPVTEFLLGNPIGLDGVALLSDSHPYGEAGATWDNLSSDALSPSSFAAGITAMESLKLESGKPAGYYPDLLMVGPSNRKLAHDLCQNTMRVVPVSASGVEAYSSAVAAAAIPNTWAGVITPVVNPLFVGTYASAWCLMDTKRPGARPIVVGEAIAPASHSVTDPSSANMVNNSEAVFYIEGQAAIAGNNPYAIYGKFT